MQIVLELDSVSVSALQRALNTAVTHLLPSEISGQDRTVARDVANALDYVRVITVPRWK